MRHSHRKILIGTTLVIGCAVVAGAASAQPKRFARLSHFQWENSVRDLLRLDASPGLSSSFTGDAITGFDNNADGLLVTENLRADYQEAAETLAARVARDPVARAKILPATLPEDPVAAARAFIKDFGLRAHRRPLTEAEIDGYLALFEQAPRLAQGVPPFVAGVQVALNAFLMSPNFLYRTESATLDDYEIAAKLSYALVSSMPDDALFAAAASGTLRTRPGLLAQANRLLDSPSGEAMVDHFHWQNLRLPLYMHLRKNKKMFPEHSETLAAAMQQEILLFTHDIYKRGGGLADLLTAPYTFANGALAALYDVKGVEPTAPFARIELDPAQRAGLLTRAGFLAANAGANNPNPIQRGVFVNLAILCTSLPPPGANAPPLPKSTAAKTNRQLVESHTGEGTCGEACHTILINPAGFAFENYDAMGKYRTTDNGQPVNAADSYAFLGGEKNFKDGVEFSRVVAGSFEAHTCYAQNWMSFLYGRPINTQDEPLVKQLGERSRRENLSIRALLLEIVTDLHFTSRTL